MKTERSLRYAGSAGICVVCGLCAALGTTGSVKTGLAAGIIMAVVSVLTGLVTLAVRKLSASPARILFSLVIAAVFTSIADCVMQANFSDLREAMGIYLPLIAVSSAFLCECAFSASGNIRESASKLFAYAACGILALFVISSVREIMGTGTWFGNQIMPEGYEANYAFILPPGAFLTAAFVAEAMNVKGRKETEESKEGKS